jgi:hypothetical protein
MPEWLLPHNTHPTPSPAERSPNKPDLMMLWENGMVLKPHNSHLHPEEDGYQELVYKILRDRYDRNLRPCSS